MVSKQEVKRMIAAADTSSYNETNKAEFKRLALKLLRAAAKLLGCYGPGIVRFNAGGIAVSGDAILHSDRVYIHVSKSCCTSDPVTILVRAVSGRSDYTGFANHYYPFELLAENGAVGLADYARKIAECHASLDYSIPGQCKACTRPAMRSHLTALDAMGLDRQGPRQDAEERLAKFGA